MNILLLEDDYAIRERVKTMLEEYEYIVEAFGRIDLAKEYINENINKIDCVVLDLNMDDEWLEEFQTESKGGAISGWIFMERYILPIKPNMPTVIFSGIEGMIDISTYEKIEFLSKANSYGNKTNNLIKAIEKVTG